MDISVGQIVVWLIVGALAGSLVGLVVRRKKEGFGRWSNLGVGLVGAVIGGTVFDLFNIDLGLGEVKITFEDLISAFAGSLVFLAMLWYIRKLLKRQS